MCLMPRSYEGWEFLDHMSWLVKIAIKWNEQLFMYIDENTDLMDEQTYLNWCKLSKKLYEVFKKYKKFTDYTDGLHKYIKKDMVKKFGEEKVEEYKMRFFNQEALKSLNEYWESTELGENWDSIIFQQLDITIDHMEYYKGYMKWCVENPGHIISSGEGITTNADIWLIKDKETDKLINNPLIHLNYLVL